MDVLRGNFLEVLFQRLQFLQTDVQQLVIGHVVNRCTAAVLVHQLLQAIQALASIRIDNQFYPAKVNLAIAYNQQGQNEKAEQLLREVVTQQPELYEVAYSFGLLLVEMQKYSEAAVYLEKAVSGLPGADRIHYNLGLLYQHLGNAGLAENELKAALLLEPRNLDFQYGLVDHYLKRGMFVEARPIAEDMASMHPENPIGSQAHWAMGAYFGTVSFTPGVQLEIPVNNKWALRPYMHK